MVLLGFLEAVRKAYRSASDDNPDNSSIWVVRPFFDARFSPDGKKGYSSSLSAKKSLASPRSAGLTDLSQTQ
jgi:hypothetical protein